jgi:hypothetical protein
MSIKRNRVNSTPSPPPPSLQEGRRPQQHYTTPIKAAVLSTISFLDAHYLPYQKKQVFDHFGVNERQGYSILKERNPRRFGNSEEIETRGRPSKISNEDINKMDEILRIYGIEGRSLTWQ